MNEKQRRSLIVGIFVTFGIIIFISAIYLVGKKEYLFGSPIKISAIFIDVKGVRAGDKVRLSGIEIGTVNSVAFLNDNRVLIQMSIDQQQVSHVKKDAHATIGSEGLMGSKVIMIIDGSLQSDPVAEFDTLVTVEQIDMDDILLEVNKSSKNIAIVSEELVQITQKINRGDGIFGKIFTDTTLTRNLDDATRNIAFITENLHFISEQVNRGEGIIGKLFADTILASGLGSAGQNINEIAVNFRDITEQVNKGEGVFGRLFTDTSLTNNLFATSENLKSTSNSLMKLTEKLSNDSSALSMFIDDPIFADSLELLIDRLNIGVIEATEAADAVQRSGLIKLFSKKKKKENSEK